VEKAVRKLLVASQKSGVGKTTTSINLAAAAAAAGARVLLLDADPLSSISQSLNLADNPNRRSLRSDGIDLPGVFCRGVIAGLDVLSPYGEGGCSDDEFDELLRLISSPSPDGGYSCFIVDSPPFMGANPGQLLRSCDELVLVMRAEPMAYRTLPAFLELVQRSRKDGRGVQMRGILLTLPEGELPGGRWERELRGRFGARILPHVIPHDEEIGKAMESGRILAHSLPDAPAAAGYHALAEALALASEDAGIVEGAESPLLSAAAALEAAGAPVGRPAALATASSGNGSLPVVADAGSAEPEIVLPPATVADATEETVHEAPPVPPPPPSHRRLPRPTPARPLPRARPVPTMADDDVPDLDDLLARQALPRPAARSSTSPVRPVAGAPATPAPPTRSPKTARTINAPPPVIPMTASQPWMIWVGLAVVMGVGLRFVHLPEFMLPVAVGVAVAAAVVLALRLIAPPPPEPEPASAPAKRLAALPQPVEKIKPASHPGSRKDPNARLAALARRPASNPFPGQVPRNPEPPRSGDRRRRD
jgi:chromosome partitioning protein